MQSLTPDRSNPESPPIGLNPSVNNLSRFYKLIHLELISSFHHFKETEGQDAEEPNGLLAALSGDDDKERVRRILERGLRIGDQRKSNETTSGLKQIYKSMKN